MDKYFDAEKVFYVPVYSNHNNMDISMFTVLNTLKVNNHFLELYISLPKIH